jgi:hypothetical protein
VRINYRSRSLGEAENKIKKEKKNATMEVMIVQSVISTVIFLCLVLNRPKKNDIRAIISAEIVRADSARN